VSDEQRAQPGFGVHGVHVVGLRDQVGGEDRRGGASEAEARIGGIRVHGDVGGGHVEDSPVPGPRRDRRSGQDDRCVPYEHRGGDGTLVGSVADGGGRDRRFQRVGREERRERGPAVANRIGVEPTGERRGGLGQDGAEVRSHDPLLGSKGGRTRGRFP